MTVNDVTDKDNQGHRTPGTLPSALSSSPSALSSSPSALNAWLSELDERINRACEAGGQSDSPWRGLRRAWGYPGENPHSLRSWRQTVSYEYQ